MSRDGSGSYSLPQSAFVAGTTIEAAKVNSNFSDLASAMTASIAKDGQTTPTANLPMGGYKHTGVANGTARTHYAAVGQVADNALLYAADTGSADACAIAPSPGITAYAVGQRFTFKVKAANLTTTPTLNVNSLGAGTIVWPDGGALAAGDLPLNGLVEVVVSATTPVFHLQTVSLDTGTGAVVRATNASLTTPTMSAPTITGNGVAVTQSAFNNSTRIATTAYADRVGVQQIVTTSSGAVATGTTTIPFDDTIPQNTEGDEYLTRSITPKSATSTLIIEVELCVSTSIAAGVILALFQDSTANALATKYAFCDTAFGRDTVTLRHVMTSGTTSATTFKVRAGMDSAGTLTVNGSNTARLFGGTLTSTITITEIGS